MSFLALAPLVGIGPMGPMELLLVLAVVVIIFGAGKLPEVGGAIGKGIKEFRKATKDDEPKQIAQASVETATPPLPQTPPVVAQTPAAVCPKCGTANAPGARFCGQCGVDMTAGAVCDKCGTANAPGTRFCGQCGAALEVRV